MERKNINNVINRLMGNMKERLLFCWACGILIDHVE
ncbi:hypothetical protein glysoja_019225 [Glycine soja]|nr:hypothetical protein glysoja_019225 [Glycine soja]